MVSLEELARVAEIEFSDIVEHTETIGTKLRVVLIEDGFVDVTDSSHFEKDITGGFRGFMRWVRSKRFRPQRSPKL